MKGVTYDSIKRHKKTGFHAFSEKHIFEKTKDGGRGEGGGWWWCCKLLKNNTAYLSINWAKFSMVYPSQETSHNQSYNN